MHIELVIYVNLYSRSGIDGKAFREILSLRNDLDFGQAFIEKGSRFLILTFPKSKPDVESSLVRRLMSTRKD